MGFINEKNNRTTEEMQELWQSDEPKAFWETLGRFGFVETQKILLPVLRQHKIEIDETRLQLESQKAPENKMRSLPRDEETSSASHRPGYNKQPTGEHTDVMQVVSRLSPSYGPEAWNNGSWEDGIDRVATRVASRVDRLKMLGNGWVPQVVARIIEVQK